MNERYPIGETDSIAVAVLRHETRDPGYPQWSVALTTSGGEATVHVPGHYPGVLANRLRQADTRFAPGAKLPVPAGARLVGFADGQLVYALHDQIREYFRPRSRDVLLRRVRRPFTAEFDRRGMAWASGRRVCWAVRVNVSPVPHGNGCQG